MKKLLRVGVLVAAALGLLGTNVSPASAVTVGSATFVGNAGTPGGLGYPCTVGDIPNNVPGCVVQATDGSGARSSSFNFNSTVCVGTKTDINKPDKGGGVTTYGPGLCAIQATGTVTGFCGASTGSGGGTVAFPGKTITFGFSFTSAGGTLVITGTAGNKGRIVAVVEAIPDPLAGSCTNDTATNFIIAGSATIADTNVV